MLHFVSREVPLYLMLLTAAHALFFYRRDQERAASLARARLDALRMQLQPHFLFNALNTIAGLIHEDPERADAMVNALGDLLRRSLETTNAQESPLKQEAEFVERYLELMHARFEERLRFLIDVAPEASDALVPTMLLQPLVENAVEHGLGPIPDGGQVSVRAWRDGETLRISVIDDGVGPGAPAKRREGIGIGNTRARLHELYGDHATFSLRDSGGTVVEISLPFHTVSRFA